MYMAGKPISKWWMKQPWRVEFAGFSPGVSIDPQPSQRTRSSTITSTGTTSTMTSSTGTTPLWPSTTWGFPRSGFAMFYPFETSKWDNWINGDRGQKWPAYDIACDHMEISWDDTAEIRGNHPGRNLVDTKKRGGTKLEPPPGAERQFQNERNTALEKGCFMNFPDVSRNCLM